MIKDNVSRLISSNTAEWKKGTVEGLHYIPLHADIQDRFGTFIYKMDAGAVYPEHRHPDGEQIYVLRGSLQANLDSMKSGDFLYSPPGSVHRLETKEGCIFLVILPKPVVVIGRSGPVDFDFGDGDKP